jgi:protein-L-isoaspartate(D-aspartate) O-methyltransferase
MPNFIRQRQKMIETQLKARDITDPRVIAAFSQVNRKEFVPQYLKSKVYSDCPLPIDQDQSISQPYIVAKMCQLLELEGHEKALDIGTGSGYAAAILSHLVKTVISIERIEVLATKARLRLQRLGYENIEVVTGDGREGVVAEAPFEAIMASAATTIIPQAWKDQLRIGGRIVVPLGTKHRQRLVRLTKTSQGFKQEEFDFVAFVPLI